MVIRLRNGRTIRSPLARQKISPPRGDGREDSPVPNLRASSSSFEGLDVEPSDVESSNPATRRLKLIAGIIVVAVVMIVVRLQYLSRHVNVNPEAEKLQKLYKLSLPKSHQELVELNNELAGLDPKYILQWAHHHLHDDADAEEQNSHPLVQATSFGPTGLVILDHLAKYNLLDTIPVITMDTLHLFRESYEFYDSVQSHYHSALHLTVTKPVHDVHGKISTRTQFEQVYGSELWRKDPKTYTKLTKSDPMQQKLEDWGAAMWITGRRRSQGGERENLDVLEFEPYAVMNRNGTDAESQYASSRGRWKLNPLAYWSYEEVWSYIRENSVPYNTLYDKGYTSIGDEMTTSLPTKTSDTEEHGERSGRFNGFIGSNRECGLHVDLDMDLVGMPLDDDKIEM